MTTYNAGEYLRYSIESVFRQTYDNLQVIVVDDGSNDHSCDFLTQETFYKEHVEYYRMPENQNISLATNYGMARMKGDYLAIIDSDDVWFDNKLEKQVDYLLEHPEYQACFSWAGLIDENSEDVGERLPEILELYQASTDTREEWLRFFFFRGNRLNNPASIVTAEAAREIGGHNPAYIQGQDFDWWIRFTKKYAFCILEEPLINCRRFLNVERKNTSDVDEARATRFYNEFAQMRYHFFDDMSDELFIRAFQPYFSNPEASSAMELAYEKALLIATKYDISPGVFAVGLTKLNELLHDNQFRSNTALYEEALHKYWDLMKRHIYNDSFIKTETDQLTSEINREKERERAAVEREAKALREHDSALTRSNEREKAVLDAKIAELDRKLVIERERNNLKKKIRNKLNFSRGKR